MSFEDFFDIEEDNYKKWNETLFISKLMAYDSEYYIEGHMPSISDSEYDILYFYAKAKFPDNEYFNNIGVELKKCNKVKHKFILGSLKKFKEHNIDQWLKKNEDIIITPKFDGLSIICEYKNGEFFSAATRGDGISGTDITEKAKYFVPLKVNIDNIIVRGEILLFGDIYKELNLTNRRNAASGLVGTDSNENAHLLSVIFYELISSSINLNSEEDRLVYLNKTFPNNSTPFEKKISSDLNSEFLISTLKDLKSKFIDKFDIDGLVLTINDSLRENEKYPSNKVAFKFGDEFAIGVVKKINWSTSRTGRVVPVVELEDEVILSGAAIRNATGYNAKFIKDNDICPGKKIKIERSGDVIPKIIEVIQG